MKKIKLILSAFVLFPIVDYIWIGLLMKPFYENELGAHKRMVDGAFTPRLAPAVVVYAILAVGLIYFVTERSKSRREALFAGAFYGLSIYGVYDLTNYSTLADYSLKLSVCDMLWGAVLCSAVSLIVFLESKWLDS